MSDVPSMPVPTSTETDEAQAPDNTYPVKKWIGLGVLSLGLAIVIIDNTLLNVSLSYIIKDLHTDIQSLQWVITAYALVLAAFTITGGRLGDLFGRRKMFMLGAIIFAVGSFIASISHNMFTLLMGESIIEGFGAALMMPATASLVVANFKGKERATAFGVWGAVAGASSAIGPLLGGWLATHYSWRWGFRINIFVAAIVIIGSLLLIRESKDERRPTLDWGGVILSCLGLLGITYGIIESSTYGWWKAKQVFEIAGRHINIANLSISPIAMAIGIIFLVLFFWWEKRVEAKGKSPLVSTKLWKNEQFTSGTLTVAILTLGMTGTFFALPIYLQAVKNIDAFHTGLVFLPLSVGLLIVAPLTGIISRKIPPKYLIQFGLLLDVAAALIIRNEINPAFGTGHLIPGLALFGIGMGFVMAPISHVTLSSVPVNESGEASGVNNTMRQVGTTLGAAIVGAAVITMISSSLLKGVSASQALPAQAKQQITTAINDPKTNIEFGGLNNAPAGTPTFITQEIQNLAKDATTRGAKDGFLYAAIFALLGFAVSLFLPTTDVHDEAQHENQSSFADDPHRFRKLAGTIAATVIAIGGGIFMLHRSSAETISTGATLPPALTQNLIPPINGTASTGTPVQLPIAPRGNPSPTTTVPVQPSQYASSQFGFSLPLPQNIQPKENISANEVQFSQNGKIILVVESYQNTNADLATLKNQMNGSPGVSNLENTVIDGQPALNFTLKGSSQNMTSGYACIKGNRLYYIFSSPSGMPIIQSIHFQ